ncbi:hypothetical protein HY638_00215 [Candidatus Woesearchaeota archaeon]|nr:hypothetical protein [Candidatus Woesearchaeota archaeon]
MKKAQAFPAFLVVTFVISMTYALVLLSDDKFDYIRQPIGEQQLVVLSMVYEGEKVLNYVDTSAVLALNDAMHEFAETGGAGEAQGCRTYLGYTVWGDNCVPSEENFKEIFQNSINPYISDYPLQGIPFIITISGTTVTGISGEYVHVNLPAQKAMEESEKTGEEIEKIKERPSLIVEVTDEGLTKAKYSYEQCDAMSKAVLRGGTGLSEDNFVRMADNGQLVSIESPNVVFQRAETNVMQKNLAQNIVAAANAWSQQNDGNGRIQISSACTGTHGKNSPHNFGKAADITGCWVGGSYYDFKCVNPELTAKYRNLKCSEEDKRIANECYSLLAQYKSSFSRFIGPNDCSQKDCPTHYNHIDVAI